MPERLLASQDETATKQATDENQIVRRDIRNGADRLRKLLRAERPANTADGAILTATFTKPEMDEIFNVSELLDDLDSSVACLRPVMPPSLSEKSRDLVRRVAQGLAEKLAAKQGKYPGDPWAKGDWINDCQRQLQLHVEKGDPMDVIAFCAFCLHHGWLTKNKGAARPELFYKRNQADEALDGFKKWLESHGHWPTQIEVMAQPLEDRVTPDPRAMVLKLHFGAYTLMLEINSVGGQVPEKWPVEALVKKLAETFENAWTEAFKLDVRMNVMARLQAAYKGVQANFRYNEVNDSKFLVAQIWKEGLRFRTEILRPKLTGNIDQEIKDIEMRLIQGFSDVVIRSVNRKNKAQRIFFRGKRVRFLGRTIGQCDKEVTKLRNLGGQVVDRFEKTKRGANLVVVPRKNHQMRNDSGYTFHIQSMIERAQAMKCIILTVDEFKKKLA